VLCIVSYQAVELVNHTSHRLSGAVRGMRWTSPKHTKTDQNPPLSPKYTRRRRSRKEATKLQKKLISKIIYPENPKSLSRAPKSHRQEDSNSISTNNGRQRRKRVESGIIQRGLAMQQCVEKSIQQRPKGRYRCVDEGMV